MFFAVIVYYVLSFVEDFVIEFKKIQDREKILQKKEEYFVRFRRTSFLVDLIFWFCWFQILCGYCREKMFAKITDFGMY